ncbi:hypothetical protein JHK87_000773 [Glycine soja]|nr:hypothetical protein JHK87_000773 [Glycine soja]
MDQIHQMPIQAHPQINNGGIFRFKHHLAGTRWDSKPCALVPEEVKMLMMKVVAEVANASEKRRKLNSIHEEGEGDGGNVELVGDVRGSSNDLVIDAFDLDNLSLVEPNNDAQFEKDLDDDGDGDESDDILGDDPIRGLDMLL